MKPVSDKERGTSNGSHTGGLLVPALTWARKRRFLPDTSREYMAWEGSASLSWVNWALVLASALVSILIIWYVGWIIAGGVHSALGGSGDLTLGVEGTTGLASGGPSGEAGPGGLPSDVAPSGTGGIPAGTESGPAGLEDGLGQTGALTLESYTTRLRQDLFGVGSVPESAHSLPTAGPLPADLRLQGVILGDPPQAIIYDGRMGVTHVVTLGDQVGEILVEAIRKDVVVISFRGQSTELRL